MTGFLVMNVPQTKMQSTSLLFWKWLTLKLNRLQNPKIGEISNSFNLVSEIVHINELWQIFIKFQFIIISLDLYGCIAMFSFQVHKGSGGLFEHFP
jgi:hypothetical protein